MNPVNAPPADLAFLEAPLNQSSFGLWLRAFVLIFVCNLVAFGLLALLGWEGGGIQLPKDLFVSFVVSLWFVWSQRCGSVVDGVPGVPRIRQTANVALPAEGIDAALERLRQAVHARKLKELEPASGGSSTVAFHCRLHGIEVRASAHDAGVTVESRPRRKWQLFDNGKALQETLWAVSVLRQSIAR